MFIRAIKNYMIKNQIFKNSDACDSKSFAKNVLSPCSWTTENYHFVLNSMFMSDSFIHNWIDSVRVVSQFHAEYPKRRGEREIARVRQFLKS